jgi:hypothetical protein
MKLSWVASAAAAFLLSIPAAASPPRALGQPATIPYASSDGIQEWKVAGPDSLYVRDIMGDWYLVRTSAPCPRLRSAQTLGFITLGTDRLDRFSTIVAEGWRCQIDSITTSAPPPPGVARRG